MCICINSLHAHSMEEVQAEDIFFNFKPWPLLQSAIKPFRSLTWMPNKEKFVVAWKPQKRFRSSGPGRIKCSRNKHELWTCEWHHRPVLLCQTWNVENIYFPPLGKRSTRAHPPTHTQKAAFLLLFTSLPSFVESTQFPEMNVKTGIKDFKQELWPNNTWQLTRFGLFYMPPSVYYGYFPLKKYSSCKMLKAFLGF